MTFIKQELNKIASDTNRKKSEEITENDKQFADNYQQTCCCKEIMHLMIDGHITEEQKQIFQTRLEKDNEYQALFQVHHLIKENIVCCCQEQYKIAPQEVIESIKAQIQQL